MTDRYEGGTIAAMLRRKRAKEQAPPAQAEMPQTQSGPTVGSNGYVVSEIPTYWAGKRRIVVYTSDPSGKIIKTFKKG